MDADIMAEAPEGQPVTSNDPADYLAPTWYMDFEHPLVQAFVKDTIGDAATEKEKAVRLFYAVRDGIRYDAYGTSADPADYKASRLLELGKGYCIQKGILMSAACRAAGIPARPGYSDVVNHLATPRLLELLGTDIFSWHGWVEMWLDGRWVKATPVFNIELCEALNVHPQEFDGETDTLFQEYNKDGERHMQYVKDHGAFDNLPFRAVMEDFDWRYEKLMKMVRAGEFGGDMQKEAEKAGVSA